MRTARERAGTSVKAVVLRGSGGVWRVRDAAGAEHEVSLRGRVKQRASSKLVVGDEVDLERDARDGTWAITEILPRRSRLARRAPGGAHGERVVAANVDQMVVVFAAAHPTPNARMLDRFLVIAAANDVPARIVINKRDLAPDDARDVFSPYAAAGYPVHETSVSTGQGLGALRDVLSGRVSALTGPSGVGKSSLLNAMYPGLALRVGEISRSVDKGRHTTVGVTMHPLPDGGYVMDTPGLREVGVWNVAPDELDRCFPEFRRFIAECRFRDCRHHDEPGCAVRAAVEAGGVAIQRYDSFRRLMVELEAAPPNR